MGIGILSMSAFGATIPYATLPGGAKLPMLYMGFGNFTAWVELAGRGSGVKTAWSYHNQQSVLPQVYAAGFTREDVFLETMIPCGAVDHPAPMNASEAEAYIAADLEQLNTSYVDLLAIHHRCNTPEETALVWSVLEAARKRGAARSIGVSNFEAADLKHLLTVAKEPIAVNEAHFAVGVMDWEMVAFAKANGIQLISFSSLAAGVPMDHPVLVSVAAKYGVSTEVVAYKYVSAHGIALLSSMSDSHPEYAKEDVGIFGFDLGADDMSTLDALQTGKRTCADCFTDVCQECGRALVELKCPVGTQTPGPWGRDNPESAQCLACAAAHNTTIMQTCGAQYMVEKACGQAGGFPSERVAAGVMSDD